MWTDALRALRELIPGAELIHEQAPVDERMPGAYDTQPELRPAHVIEGTVLRAMRVVRDSRARGARFAGFLDGIQRTSVPAHWQGVPVVLATTGAVVRVRRGRRLVTWGHQGPRVESRFYVPWAHVAAPRHERIGRYEVVDTSVAADGAGTARRAVAPHPAALRAVAFERVGRDRERAERALAERWCAFESEPLYVDGPLSASRVVAESELAVGVVKSHTILHADGVDLRTVMRLGAGERTSVFLVEHPERPAVASWYLRLRGAQGRDPMFGLVRVEVAVPRGDAAARADAVSRWVLDEMAPVALPDARWDRMAYGIRDCEEFLRAVAP